MIKLFKTLTRENKLNRIRLKSNAIIKSIKNLRHIEEKINRKFIKGIYSENYMSVINDSLELINKGLIDLYLEMDLFFEKYQTYFIPLNKKKVFLENILDDSQKINIDKWIFKAKKYLNHNYIYLFNEHRILNETINYTDINYFIDLSNDQLYTIDRYFLNLSKYNKQKKLINKIIKNKTLKNIHKKWEIILDYHKNKTIKLFEREILYFENYLFFSKELKQFKNNINDKSFLKSLAILINCLKYHFNQPEHDVLKFNYIKINKTQIKNDKVLAIIDLINENNENNLFIELKF